MKSKDRWKLRFDSFCKALAQLENAVNQKTYTNLEQQGLIKCFEYTFELAWKTLQDYLNHIGYNTKGPNPVIKQAFQDNIIIDGKIWAEMLLARNMTTHIYDENNANEILNKIINQYYFLFKELKTKLLKEYNTNMQFGLDNETYTMIKNVFYDIDEVEEVVVFGSRVANNEYNSSDIDLALKGKNINFDTVLEVKMLLEKLPVAYKFDVVNYNTASSELKEQIDKYGEKINI
ncbi:MAG: HI0074 family nucleotidyltransferase substrate-binding subunit [Bacteroidetes bacterium]|nr:HI0074 family nucleotidyltransferase substrate-binding subunit [Bacteroidota bacterium]